MCERRNPEGIGTFRDLAAEAGLDVRRFGIDLESTAILEAFGADLEAARVTGSGSGLPIAEFRPRRGSGAAAAPGIRADVHRVTAVESYEAWRSAALAAGARSVNPEPPSLQQAFDRFGRLADAELRALTGIPEPVLEAELWTGAREWRYRPMKFLTGTLWQRV